jgi:hypothetical protein
MRTPRESHEARKRELEREAAEVARRIARIAMLRLVVAVAAAALFVGAEWGGLGMAAAIGAAVLAGAFVVLVAWHGRVHREADRLAAAIRHHELAMGRLDGKFAEHGARGERFLSADHPYAADLDVFGRASIFQLLDATHTRLGEERLAAWLASPSGNDEVRGRQRAVRELAARERFREELEVEGLLLASDKPDPAPLLAWAEAPATTIVPRALVPLLWLAPALVVALFVLARLSIAPESAWIVAAVVVAAWGLSKLPKVEPIATALNAREGALERYRAMIERIVAESFESPKLCAIREALGTGDDRAAREIERLSAIAGYFDARRNEVFRFFVGPVLLWDLHCVAALERWQARSGARVRAWLEAVGEMEALASLAGFAADRPDHAFPEVVDRPTFEAVALGHPLLPADKCVRNDVRLDGPGTALLVTGSNSRERRLGARAVLQHLLERGAMGAVSTHDLGLVDVGPALDARVRRVHFEEQVEGDEMTFDYRLRPGVVRSSNALRLMRMVGIDVELPPDG